MKEIIYYFQSVLIDGDYLNDWLTHVPYYLQEKIKFAGFILSYVVKIIDYIF